MCCQGHTTHLPLSLASTYKLSDIMHKAELLQLVATLVVKG